MDDKQSDRIASERSFVEREIAKRAHGVHRLKSKDSSGRRARYFILVEPHRVSEFTSAIKVDGMIDLKNYGRIIASNYGKDPSEEVRLLIKEQYGFRI